MPFIYKIKNAIDKKTYIGKTKDSIEKRFEAHKAQARTRHKHGNRLTYLWSAMIKHGFENFSISLLEEVESTDPQVLSEKEMLWIEQLKPHYNLTKGGDGSSGYTWSEEAKARKSAQMKGRFSIHHPETLEEIRVYSLDAHPGWVRGRSPKHKNIAGARGVYDEARNQRIKEARIKNGTWKKPRSEETKRKISEAFAARRLAKKS